MSKPVLVANVQLVLDTDNVSEAADIVSTLLRKDGVLDWMHMSDFWPAEVSDEYEEGEFFDDRVKVQ